MTLVGLTIAPANAVPAPGQDENWSFTSGYEGGYPPACANVLFIGVRGSGEQDSENYGPMVRAVRDGLRETLPRGFTVRQLGLGYPARSTNVLGEDLVNLETTYFDGMLQGAQQLWSAMEDSATRCPDEQIVLAGYSQGAGVIHRVLVDFPHPNKLRTAVLIADPGRFYGPRPGTLYGAPKRIGGLLPTVGLTLDPIGEVYRPKVIEYCKTADPICDLGAAVEFGVNAVGISARVNNDMHIHGEYKLDHLKKVGNAIGLSMKNSAPPAPVIHGGQYPGWPLTAHTPGLVAGSQPLTYQWYKDHTPIPGATERTYTTSWDDVFPGPDWIGSGTRITVRVTAPGSTYEIKSATSRGMYFWTPTPSIGGTMRVGQTILAKIGTWSPEPYQYQYQWYRALPSDPNSRRAIPGATSKSYKLTTDDAGAVLQVVTTVDVPHPEWPQYFESRSSFTAPVLLQTP